MQGGRDRLKRRAASPEEVRAKLRQTVRVLTVKEQGWSPVERVVATFLVAPSTVTTYWGLVNAHLIPQLGETLVLELSADRVEQWLHNRAKVLASSTLGLLHGLLKRTLRRAQRHDKVARNVGRAARGRACGQDLQEHQSAAYGHQVDQLPEARAAPRTPRGRSPRRSST